MKNKLPILIIIVFLVSCKTAIAPFKGTNFVEEIYPYLENGLWGYNTKTGQRITEPKFDDAFISEYGLAKIKKNGRYGFIDMTGHLRIKPKYITASNFNFPKSHSWTGPPTIVAIVQHRNKKYYLDQFGKKTKREQVHSSNLLNEVTAIEVEHPLAKSIIKSKGKYELEFEYQIENIENQKETYRDTTTFYLDTIIMINQSIMACKAKKGYGVLFASQLKGIPPGLTPNNEYVYKPKEYQPDIRFEFQDLKYATTKENRKARYFLFASKGNKWGIINYSGKTIVPFDYINIKSVDYNGHALVEYEEDKFGYISIIYEYDENENIKYSIEEHFKK